jgi:hypothetical protein
VTFFRRLKMPPVPALGRLEFKRAVAEIEDYFRKIRDALSAYDPDISPVVVGENPSDGAVNIGSSATIATDETVSGTVTLYVVDDSITDAKLRDSAGFSVIGKATTGSGETADIVAGTDTVLGRVGSGNLAFAQVATGQIAADAVTYAKIQNVTASRVLGRGSAGGSGDVEELTPTSGIAVSSTSLVAVPVVLRPAQITADQNDYSPGTLGTDRTTVFVSTDASRNITGILATGIADGVTLTWINSGTQSVMLQNANGGSVAANQLICPSGDLTLAANAAALIVRDATASRWRVFAL